MGEPNRLGDGYVGDMPSVGRPSYCGGASLRLGIDDYRRMEREGVVWATRSDQFRNMLDNGKAYARVSCGGEAMPGYALCSSCAAQEANWRRVLRELARTAKVEPR